MSIHEVKRVMVIGWDELHRVGEKMWDANEYLAEGWVLLDVHHVSSNSDNGPTQNARFVLGWTGDAEPPSDIQKRQDKQRALEVRRRNIEIAREILGEQQEIEE